MSSRSGAFRPTRSAATMGCTSIRVIVPAAAEKGTLAPTGAGTSSSKRRVARPASGKARQADYIIVLFTPEVG